MVEDDVIDKIQREIKFTLNCTRFAACPTNYILCWCTYVMR